MRPPPPIQFNVECVCTCCRILLLRLRREQQRASRIECRYSKSNAQPHTYRDRGANNAQIDTPPVGAANYPSVFTSEEAVDIYARIVPIRKRIARKTTVTDHGRNI